MKNTDMENDFLYKTMIKRHSIRAFMPQNVDEVIIRKILEASLRAPSAKNTQPWRIVHVRKGTMEKITTRYMDAFQSGVQPHHDMEISPYEGSFRKNAVELGKMFYGLLGIGREDKEKKMEVVYQNYRFWNAPAAFFLYSLKGIRENEIFDLGIFSGVLLAMMESYGLGSIFQASLVDYPDILREILGLEEGVRMITGISFGYPDLDAKINTLIPPRYSLAEVYIKL